MAMRLYVKRGVLPIFEKVLRQEAEGFWTELLSTIAIPLSFFLAFGLGLRDYILEVEGEPYMVFMAPGLIALTILLEAYRTGGWGLWHDRWHQRMIDEYRIKPVTTYDIIVGEILGGFVVALVKGLIVGGILFLLAPVRIHWGHLALFLLYMLPGAILFTSVGTMVGISFRRPDQIAQIQTFVITPLLYLGGVFFPIKAFPGWMFPTVNWLPTTALFDGSRAAFLHGEFSLFYVGISWAYALVSFFAATWLFDRNLSE